MVLIDHDISEGFIGIRSERKTRKGLGEKGITKLSLERHQGSKYNSQQDLFCYFMKFTGGGEQKGESSVESPAQEEKATKRKGKKEEKERKGKV